MRCDDCGLPDPYNGAGDGIGSCECPRCDCCGAGPRECECNRDWDDGGFDEDYDPNEPIDYLCNDRACGHRHLRIARRLAEAQAGETP